MPCVVCRVSCRAPLFLTRSWFRSVNRYSSTFTRGGGSSSTTAGSGGGVSEAAGVGDAGGVGNAGVGVSNRVVEGAAVEGFRYGYGGAGRAVTRGGAVDRSPGGRVGSDAPSGRLLGAGGAHARSGCSRGGFGSGLPPFCLSDEGTCVCVDHVETRVTVIREGEVKIFPLP